VRNHNTDILSVNAFILVTGVTTEKEMFIRGVKKRLHKSRTAIPAPPPPTSTCYYYRLDFHREID
jgi:hypothetical protein